MKELMILSDDFKSSMKPSNDFKRAIKTQIDTLIIDSITERYHYAALLKQSLMLRFVLYALQ